MSTSRTARGSLPALRKANPMPPSPSARLAKNGALPSVATAGAGAGGVACRKCGAAFTKATAKFCSRCGAKKSAGAPPAQSSLGGSTTELASTDGGGAPPPPPHSTSPSATMPYGGTSGSKTVGPPTHDRNSVKRAPPVGGAATTKSASPAPPVQPASKGSDTLPHSTAEAAAAATTSPHHRDASGPSPPAAVAPAPTKRPALKAGGARKGSVKGAAAEDVAPPPQPSSSPPPPPGESAGDSPADGCAGTTSSGTMGSFTTLEPSPEEEAQYTAWTTLGPDGLTPEMLQTKNAAAELQSWRKGSLIGRGTYGSVYLGLLSDGSFYAVKSVELGGKHAADMAFNIRELVSLSREINMMQRLRHRNLCTFKGVLYEKDTTSICMFMEYVGGGSLSSIVKRFKPLPAEVVRRWTRQLLKGLLYLHSQHIIHRDVKGDNVLIDTSASPGSESQVKLVDFGAARRLTDAVSQSRTVIGTPYWMAPEVVDVSGEGKGYSYKADVWSVGCTVAEMLTGRPPWPARSSAPAAIMMVASAEGMPTEVPKEEATAGCYDFMIKCFERDPEQRPTVEELLHHPWILGEME